MSAAIVKAVKRYGNSGGVYVPNHWIGGKVRIELVEEPLNPQDVVAKIPLEHVISVILYGSYARGEASEGSDIDILLIVDDDYKMDIPAEIMQKYDIQVKCLRDMRNALVHDPVFYKMIKDEAVALVNHQFLDSLKEEVPKMADIEKRIEMIESSLDITKEILKIDANADVAYPIVMRLKEILLIECLLSGKKYSTKALKQEILGCGITTPEFSALMDSYRASRANKRAAKCTLQTGTIAKLISLLEEKMQHVRKKAREKRN